MASRIYAAPGEQARAAAPLLPLAPPTTLAKVCTALERATWGERLMMALFALAFVAMVLAMAVFA